MKWLGLTLVAALFHFLRAIGNTLLIFVAVIFALLGIVTLFTASGNAYMIRSGIAGLVSGFLRSLYDQPALAGLLIELLDGNFLRADLLLDILLPDVS